MSKFSGVLSCAVVVLVVGSVAPLVVAQDGLFDSPDLEASQVGTDEGSGSSTDVAERDTVLDLTHLAAADAGAPHDRCRCIGDTDAPSVVKIHEALCSPLKEGGFAFNEQPLQEIMGLLQEEYGIPVQIDKVAFDEAEVAPDEPITIAIRDISLRAALELMLKQKGLIYVIDDEVLLITTPDEYRHRLRTCVYDVRDLIQPKHGQDFDSLTDSIVSCISTETWAENGGGEAEIGPVQPGFLIVSQTQAIHDDIRELLATIRAMRKSPVADAQASAAPDADEVVTKFYRLQIGQAVKPDEVRGQVRELIAQLLPDERWGGKLNGGEPVLLAVMNDRVVVRHKTSVQEKIAALLVDSGLAASSSSHGRRRARGGGISAAGGSGENGVASGGGGGGFFRSEPAKTNSN